MPIVGAHMLLYTPEAEASRACEVELLLYEPKHNSPLDV
jgi:hypothetical protein